MKKITILATAALSCKLQEALERESIEVQTAFRESALAARALEYNPSMMVRLAPIEAKAYEGPKRWPGHDPAEARREQIRRNGGKR